MSTRKKTRDDRYFPIITSQSLTGEVNNNSMVPSFCSSANSLIVRAGAKRTITRLAPKKRLLKDASGNGSVKSLTKKNPVTAKNIRATRYATGLLKYI